MKSGTQSIEQYYRYCPDAPQIHISDSVCFGRQRVAYPPCKDCQFNYANQDRQPGMEFFDLLPAKRREESPSMMDTLFKAYDVRAKYPEPLNEAAAWSIGNATAQFLRASLQGVERSSPEANTLVVGCDMRRSSPSLRGGFIAGARAAGANVIDIGMIDTSQIVFGVNHFHAGGGVQVTASHNPAEYNGFKICGKKGRPVGQETGLQEICRIASKVARHETSECGSLRQEDLSESYKEFVRGYLKPTRPLTIAVDASNGMAGRWFPILFNDVEAFEVIKINFKHDGTFVHEPNPLVDANLEQTREAVLEHKADFGVCFDGDADRLMVVDEKGRIVRCDLLTAVLAGYFLRSQPGGTVVFDLRSSRAVREMIEEAGGTPRRERVGHAFMKQAMAESDAVFGGELSGHFYFADNWYCDSGMLAFVHLVNLINQHQEPLSKILKPARRYAASGERNFENEKKDETIEALGRLYSSAEVDHLDGITVQEADWWFNVRKSNTEPLLRLNLEAKTKKAMQKHLAEVAQHLGKPVAH
ncbi:MAG: phosphomannomutase/phosphoglucomutase [Planctomycetota bacterium]|nr:phosphomannomutase/phosphoglucomutase [Planctomycetota bacterium]